MVPGDFAVLAYQVAPCFWDLQERFVALRTGLELEDLGRVLPRPHGACLPVVSEVGARDVPPARGSRPASRESIRCTACPR